MPGYIFEYTTRVTVTADSLPDAREMLNRKGWRHKDFIYRQTVPVVRMSPRGPSITSYVAGPSQESGDG